jgi:predicted component of type VI protein secretion system
MVAAAVQAAQTVQTENQIQQELTQLTVELMVEEVADQEHHMVVVTVAKALLELFGEEQMLIELSQQQIQETSDANAW